MRTEFLGNRRTRKKTQSMTQTIVFVAAMYCAFGINIESMAQSIDSSHVLVLVRVNTAYDDSQKSLDMLTALIKEGPSRQIAVAKGDNVSSLIVREYGFGPSDLPKSYKLLEDAIVSRNNLTNATGLKPGSMVIPAVPRRAWMDINPANLINFVPNVSVFDAMYVEPAASKANRKSGTGMASIQEAKASELAYERLSMPQEPRLAAQFELMNFELPLKAAQDFLKSSHLAKESSAFTFPMSVRLAGDESCNQSDPANFHDTLMPNQAQMIRTMLADHVNRSATLFILDTGWPDKTAYDESLSALEGVLQVVWKNYFHLNHPKLRRIRKLPSPNQLHCKCIERSLSEFRALDPKRQIKVVYVPMTREQGAAPVLTDILETAYLLQQVSTSNATINRSIVAAARAQAASVVAKHFPDKWVGDEVETDKSIMEGILLVGNKYAEVEQSLIFVNESWTVNHEQYFVNFPSPLDGNVVAATGNADENVNIPLRDFAQRSLQNRDTIAVLNMQQSALICHSSRIDKRDLDTSLAIGFDGQVTVTMDVCGTSFSAPRVGWILAAGEVVSTNVDPHRWGNDLHDCLLKLRPSDAQGYGKLNLDPVRYVNAMANGICGESPGPANAP